MWLDSVLGLPQHWILVKKHQGDLGSELHMERGLVGGPPHPCHLSPGLEKGLQPPVLGALPEVSNNLYSSSSLRDRT